MVQEGSYEEDTRVVEEGSLEEDKRVVDKDR